MTDIIQVLGTNGWETFLQFVRPDFVASVNHMFQSDRVARAAGQAPTTIPVIHAIPWNNAPFQARITTSSSPCGKRRVWRNEVTLRGLEGLRTSDPSQFIAHISPTPLLMFIASNDCVTPTDLAPMMYTQALEPKELVMLPDGHFDVYQEALIGQCIERHVGFLQETLCK